MLRALKQYRNMGLVARGYKFLCKLHEDERTKLYLTTIAEGNDQAISILTSGRAGLPRYHFAGKYNTIVIPVVRKPRAPKATRSITVRPATLADLAVLLEFLERIGPARQFFPRYKTADFFNSQGTFKDLCPSDLLLAFRDGRLVGTMGGWDQHRFRQTVVERYETLLRWTRPAYNCWAKLRRQPRLPKSGEPLRYRMVALPCAENNDREVFGELLEALLARASVQDGEYVLLGMHETDPLLPLAKKRGTTSYVTRLYHACWKDGEELRNQLDSRPTYLELGCL